MINDGEYYLNNNATVDEINSVTNFKYNLDYNHDELGGAEYLPYTEYMNYKDDSLAIKFLDKNNAMIDYIYEYDKHFTSIEFTCDNQEDVELLLPLSYYKGYKAYEFIEKEYKTIDVSSDKKYKLVELYSSKGSHTYKVTYEGTVVQKETLVISTLSFAIIFGYGILKKIILKK